MNKKSLLGLILFASLVIAGMFFTTALLLEKGSNTDNSKDRAYIAKEDSTKEKPADQENSEGEPTVAAGVTTKIEEATAGFASDTTINSMGVEPTVPVKQSGSDQTEDSMAASVNAPVKTQLINDSTKVDYKAYIPEMQVDDELRAALNISKPDIHVDAKAAILFNADTKKVLYYKNAVKAVFPASTLKLLTCLVALNWCSVDEKVTIGDEVTMIAPDSTRAYLKEGQVLTVSNLMEGMLLPSGNDAAYAMAAYVGRKSLGNEEASKEEAVAEFVRLMNEQAKKLGVKNSCFKTPDGYDAVGQYTTAYDMGLIGIAAASNDTIVSIAGKSSSRNTFISGEDVTWDNTNKLIRQGSGEYYAKAIGLKTGTSSMAGRCLIAAAEQAGKKVLCVIMDSTSTGRWEDAIALMKYGLE